MPQSHTNKWRGQLFNLLSWARSLAFEGCPSALGLLWLVGCLNPHRTIYHEACHFLHFWDPVSTLQRELLIVQTCPCELECVQSMAPLPHYNFLVFLSSFVCLSICLWIKTQNWFHSSIQEPSLPWWLWPCVPNPPSWGVCPAVA